MSPPQRPTLIALHGHDDDESATRQWAERLLPTGWSLQIPLAEGASWFDTTARGADPASLERSRRILSAVAQGTAARSGGPVVLAGFSQGAAMALALGDVEGVVGVVGLCPFLPESDDLDLAAGPPALLLPATDDDVVPAFLGEDAASAMGMAGREVSVSTVAGGHMVRDEAATQVRSWIENLAPARMRFSMGLPVDRVSAGEELVSGEAIAELSAAFEGLGFDAAFVTDHPAPDDRWLQAGGHHALEPTVALSTAAAATSRLRLHTHVMVLAYRNPFLAAKAVSSLDVVSSGRVILGVAAGYLRPEFDALGVDFENRGDLLDESLELIRRIWTEESVAAASGVEHSVSWSARSVTALPRPPQRPGPPVWIGGNSVRAMRRAAEMGDGWSPFPAPAGLARAARTASISGVEELRSRLARFDEVCDEAAREQRPTVCFSPFSMHGYHEDTSASAALAEEVQELAELGVDWLTVSVPGNTRAEVVDRSAALSEVLELS
ncbi:MAG: TIGR03619 family F420-dependent LLM class oxidoreductase [Microthrixaceae bacterium]